jgi:hypothetical protein
MLKGENLFWFTPKGYIGQDPERTDVNRIPVPTTFTNRVNLGLINYHEEEYNNIVTIHCQFYFLTSWSGFFRL